MRKSEEVNKSVNIEFLKVLQDQFPFIFEEGKINLDTFSRFVGDSNLIKSEDNRFYFNWTNKNNLMNIIQSPSYCSLSPDYDKSTNFDNTENLMIVGENLEVLKLLTKQYFSKVKMIYIDPPYNTGKDFIYSDNFTEPLQDYLEKTGQIDSEGKKLTTNMESNGRFHSDWLNFMYPRLFLARNFLREDGVILVSIDDGEIHNLRKIMDEIFGEENFIATIIWEKKYSPQNDALWLSDNHDFILLYARDKTIWRPKLLPRTEEANSRYSNPDNDIRGPWKSGDLSVRTYTAEYDYPITTPSGRIVNPPKGRCWSFPKESFKRMVADKRIWFGKEGNNVPSIKQFISEVKQGITSLTIWKREEVGDTQSARREIRDLFSDSGVFDTPKPVRLIKKMLHLCTESSEGDIILDFFAGSGTTGHAVWDLNHDDSGNRKFILVNIDEKVLRDSVSKEFPTVSDVCIERLKRATKTFDYNKQDKITEFIKGNDKETEIGKIDFGFKVFKLINSNFNLENEFKIDNVDEELLKKYREWLGLAIDQSILPESTSINILYEIIIKQGFDLHSKIEKVKIKENSFFKVLNKNDELNFYFSFDEKIAEETIENIRTEEYRDNLFIFRDSALSDNDKINLKTVVRLKIV